MVLTLVVSGAIFGLLTAGGNAFRREPEVADRQQNIRIAMDTIARDIENAGAGMPLVSQVFTHTDDPTGGPAPTGAGTPVPERRGTPGRARRRGRGPARRRPRPAPAPTPPTTATSSRSLMADAELPRLPRVRSRPARQRHGGPPCPHPRGDPRQACLVPPGDPGDHGARPAHGQPAVHHPARDPQGRGHGLRRHGRGTNGELDLADALPEWPTVRRRGPHGVAGGIPALAYSAQVVRYMIAPGLDPLDTSPGLWRSETGRYDATGAAAPAPVVGTTNWQIVARGIEDLQVEYLNGGGLWSNNPGVIEPARGRRLPAGRLRQRRPAGARDPVRPQRWRRCSRARPCPRRGAAPRTPCGGSSSAS